MKTKTTILIAMTCALLVLGLAVIPNSVMAAGINVQGEDNGFVDNEIRVDKAYIENVVLPAKRVGELTGEMRLALKRYIEIQLAAGRRSPARDDQGGPDEGGYYWADTEEEGGPEFEWIDITQVGQSLQPDDDWNSGALDLGWTFNFYGTDYTQIYICSNGWASFTSEDVWYPEGGSDFPNGDQTYGTILAVQPFDLDPDVGGALYFYADDGIAVISWEGIPGFDGEAASTFQIIITGDGNIRFQYAEDDAPTGDNVVVGIQNAGADIGITAVNQEQGRLVNGYAIEFSFEAIDENPRRFDVPDEYETIQAAIDATEEEGDVVYVLPGTYNENLSVDKGFGISLHSRYVDSADEADIANTIIDGSNNDRVILISANSPLNGTGFTIQNGAAAFGGGIFTFADLSLNNCILKDNESGNDGGAIYSSLGGGYHK